MSSSTLPLRTAILKRSPSLSKLGEALVSLSAHSEQFHLSRDNKLYTKGREVPLSTLNLFDMVHEDLHEGSIEEHTSLPRHVGWFKTTREGHSLSNVLMDNRLISIQGLRTPKRVSVTLSNNSAQDFESIKETLDYPFVARPLKGHIGFNVKRVSNDTDLREFLREAPEEVLFEEHVPGLTAWVLVLPGLRSEETYTAVPVGKVAPGVFGPLNLKEPLKSSLLNTAIETAAMLGIEKLALLSFRLAADGSIIFLKGNPYPDMSERPQFETALEHTGISYAELAEHLLSKGV